MSKYRIEFDLKAPQVEIFKGTVKTAEEWSDIFICGGKNKQKQEFIKTIPRNRFFTKING